MARKIFVDTNPIIYLVSEEQPYYEKVLAYLADGIRDKAEFYTSTVTDAEFLVKPFAEKDSEKIESFRNYIQRLNFLKCFITEQIAEAAAKIRAKYSGVKLGDALQLAASIDCGCDSFLTNDKRLKQVAEANVVYLGDL